MKLTKLKSAAVAALIFAAGPLVADGMMVEDAYARSSTANSTSGAAFMMLKNATDQDDRLIAASSTVSKKVELHTHTEDDNGVMRMGQIEGGVPVAAGETHHFKRGGDHLMFMGLTGPLTQGGIVNVTLVFEKAGEVQIEIPVDQERKPDHGAMKHGG